MKIAILGYGREGRAIHKFLKSSPDYRGAKVWILDKVKHFVPSQHSHFFSNLSHRFGKNYLKNLDQFDFVFRSPGVPYNLPEIQRAIKRGVIFSSATKLFFEQLRGLTLTARGLRRPIIIGITGTKGKGTTSTLLYQILKNWVKARLVYLAGNIGKPALDILPQIQRQARSAPRKSAIFVILELSSFQLQDMRHSPRIAAVLDIFPDHLDSHKNFREYFNAKTSIGRYQSIRDKIFYFPDNKWSAQIARQSRGKKIPVSPNTLVNLLGYTPNSRELGIQLPGKHNLKNAAMAAAIAKHLGCPEKTIIKTIKTFRGLEHRLELIRSMQIESRTNAERTRNHAEKSQRKIIEFYNDSASTNPQTAAAAVLAFADKKSRTLHPKPPLAVGRREAFSPKPYPPAGGLNPIILIAGGKDKNLNYKPLTDAIKKAKNVKAVILFGENKNKIIKELRTKNLELKTAANLSSAIKLAYKTAKKLINSSTHQLITVLFSPGAASFDMFKDYKDRGEQFKKAALRLK